jgi:hypothetical protein
MTTPLLGISLLVSSEALSYLLWRNALSNRSAKTTVIKGSTNPPKNGIEHIIANDTVTGLGVSPEELLGFFLFLLLSYFLPALIF